MTVLQAQLQ